MPEELKIMDAGMHFEGTTTDYANYCAAMDEITRRGRERMVVVLAPLDVEAESSIEFDIFYDARYQEDPEILRMHIRLVTEKNNSSFIEITVKKRGLTTLPDQLRDHSFHEIQDAELVSITFSGAFWGGSREDISLKHLHAGRKVIVAMREQFFHGGFILFADDRKAS